MHILLPIHIYDRCAILVSQQQYSNYSLKTYKACIILVHKIMKGQVCIDTLSSRKHQSTEQPTSTDYIPTHFAVHSINLLHYGTHNFFQ